MFRTTAPIRLLMALGAMKELGEDIHPADRAAILVVDDEEGVRELCVEALQDEGFQVRSTNSADEALNILKSDRIDIVLTDLKMPGMTGMELLEKVKQTDADTDVVVMTGFAAIDTAVRATKLGAYEYITKPFELDDLTALMVRLAERREETVEGKLASVGELIGSSGPMRDICRLVMKAAPKRCPVLLVGESGTGKEVAARAIHASSPWRDKPFVPVDCGALSPSLIESELFGHVRGSFTGATQDRHGLFRTAADGTVFLDEIGELPFELQSKLLRVLQESEFRAVGSDQRIPLRARVIAATNRDLEVACKEKTFRTDLYYRLNVVCVKLPPLRARADDIPALVSHFLKRYTEAEGGAWRVSPEAMGRLKSYEWPGNVRELENCIRRAIALTDGTQIAVRDLPPEIRASDPPPSNGRTYTPLEKAEKKAIVEALEATGGNRTLAAQQLGMGKTTLYSKLKEYGIAGSFAGSVVR